MTREYPADIMVTGGCGYIGSALVPSLLARPEVAQVVVVDNLARGRLESISYLRDQYPGRLHFIRTDLRQPDHVDAAFDRHGVPDAIVHLASTVDAATSLDEDKRILCEQVNEHATLALAERAVRTGVATLVAHSSTSVYGHSGAAVLTEDSPCAPVTPYGRTKLAGERILDLQCNRTNVIVFRPASVFGWAPGYRYEVAVNLLALYAHTGVPLTVYRTAEREHRPYLAIEDCVRALHQALTEPGPLAGQAWNALTFNATLGDVLDVIRRIYPTIECRYTDAGLVNQISFLVSGDKLYCTGYTPTGDLHTSLEKVRCQLDAVSAIYASWHHD